MPQESNSIEKVVFDLLFPQKAWCRLQMLKNVSSASHFRNMDVAGSSSPRESADINATDAEAIKLVNCLQD